MLDPSLPWLAAGYRNFKESDFHRPHSAMDSAHQRYLENGSNHRELRPTTPAQYQHRRVKSATHVRVHCGSPAIKHRLSSGSRPRSARSTTNYRNEKVGCYNYSPETIQALARRPKSASAVLLRHHRPSAAQNKSVTQIERIHHTQSQIIKQYEKVTGEEVQHTCAFCPVECRPPSSSSHRPTSSTGLLAAHLPTHHDRRYTWTRPKTAPITKREISSLPRHNNVRRGKTQYYTNFVSKLPLHLRDRTPSPPPRRRRAFQEETPPPPAPNDDDEEVELEVEDEFPEEDINIEEEEDIAEPMLEAPSPVPPSPVPPPAPVEGEPKLEPPPEAMEAWTPEIKAPTPTPTVSRRNSVQEPQKAPTPVPSPPPSPIPQLPPEKPPSPPPTPPPAKAPTPPPPKSPSPPPKSPTLPPPPELSIQPPTECIHRPKPPVPPLPKVKKEVRIQEPPVKEKVIVKKEKKPIAAVKKSPPEESQPPPSATPLKPSLKKPPPPEPVKLEPPPLPTIAPPEPVVEKPPAVEPPPKEEPKVEEPKAPEEKEPSPPAKEEKEEKKKLGPPPTKVKVDMFGMDPQELLDLQMRAKRRGNSSDDEDDRPPPGLASLLEPTNRMLKQSDWLRGRIALSRQAARFELPMDVSDLAEMSPVDYLRKHCVVSHRRRALYKKAFMKVDKDNDGKINRKELEKAVLDALVDTIQPDKVAVALGYLGAVNQVIFNSRFFACFCALLERLYYREFTKDDIGEKKDTKEKEILEEADFLCLDWKLDGQYVNPPLKELLYML